MLSCTARCAFWRFYSPSSVTRRPTPGRFEAGDRSRALASRAAATADSLDLAPPLARRAPPRRSTTPANSHEPTVFGRVEPANLKLDAPHPHPRSLSVGDRSRDARRRPRVPTHWEGTLAMSTSAPSVLSQPAEGHSDRTLTRCCSGARVSGRRAVESTGGGDIWCACKGLPDAESPPAARQPARPAQRRVRMITRGWPGCRPARRGATGDAVRDATTTCPPG